MQKIEKGRERGREREKEGEGGREEVDNFTNKD